MGFERKEMKLKTFMFTRHLCIYFTLINKLQFTEKIA